MNTGPSPSGTPHRQVAEIRTAEARPVSTLGETKTLAGTVAPLSFVGTGAYSESPHRAIQAHAIAIKTARPAPEPTPSPGILPTWRPTPWPCLGRGPHPAKDTELPNSVLSRLGAHRK